MNSIRGVIVNFNVPSDGNLWHAVNDGIMGGVSDSFAQVNADGTTTFSGTVSLENHGGFASIKTCALELNLNGYRGIMLKVRGDGKKYSFRLRNDSSSQGISYRAKFDTAKNGWKEIRLPFDSFEPTYKGRIVKNGQALKPDKIRHMGFLIADKQAGSFELTVDKIMAY